MTVTVTKPDGTTETLGPFQSDATGGAHTTYTPTALGNYTFQMNFPTQTLQGANPFPGVAPNPYVNDSYQASKSNVFALRVQQDAISYPPETPLPTNYWTRPIYAENNNWYSIAGNWLGFGVSTFANTGMYNASTNYNAYTTAPNSAHILWTKPEAFGGTIGGEFGGSEIGNYYSTSQYEPKFAPVILNGILYYTQYPGSVADPTGIVAVDLHSGATLWTLNTTTILRCGQILQYVTPNQYGALAYIWTTGNPLTYVSSTAVFAGLTYNMFDALTGNYILSIVNGTSMTLTEDSGGNLIGYFVNSSTPNKPMLSMWNSTKCINLATPYAYGGLPTTPQENSWVWRPVLGSLINFGLGIEWSVPLETNISGVPLPPAFNTQGVVIPGASSLAISGVNSGVVLMTALSNTGAAIYQAGFEIEAGYNANTGALLWITNRTLTPFARVLLGGSTMGNGVYVAFDSSTLTATAYNLNTGNKVWGPIALPNVSPFASLGMQYVVANDIIYLWTYGGDVYAFNMADGSINWQYHTPSGGYESPYGVEPLWTFTVGTVADGKLFVPEGHMYSPPLFHNAQQLALNITDGSVIWSVDAFDVTSAPAISDGVAVTLNAYDNQIYAYGKGPSSTTVEAKQFGSNIVVSGAVTDVSLGTKQQAVAANFPNGLPCVSDASQTKWMEFVYMQQPCPNNVTGVPVSIDVLDPNGNLRNIGTTKSDGSGTFALTWKPDIPGDFTVIASFAGSESYYPSNAEAHFYAPAATSTAPPATTPAPSMADLYFVPSVVAIIVIIIIGFAVMALLMLRKRP
jgi:outer membrane protein assembly factor BamB